MLYDTTTSKIARTAANYRDASSPRSSEDELLKEGGLPCVAAHNNERGCEMPTARLIPEGVFSPDDIRIITEAYNAVVAKLDLRSFERKEQAARATIELAKGKNRLNAEELVRAALDRLK